MQNYFLTRKLWNEVASSENVKYPLKHTGETLSNNRIVNDLSITVIRIAFSESPIDSA